MSTLTIRQAAAGLTLQDGGRRGYRRYGVSGSGAIDRFALAVANALVGNGPDAAAIEIAGAGGVVTAEDGPVTLAFAGPDCGARLGEIALRPGVAFRLLPGETLRFGPVRGGNYGYLGLGGGIVGTGVMGSHAMHRRSGIGGAGLAEGDRIALGDDGPTRLLAFTGAAPVAPDVIRVMAGPQDDHFTPGALAALTSSPYRVTTQLDRMGCRLDGPALSHISGYNIVSDGIVPGHIQVPGDGLPIVLLRDCQTVGGYPKIATIISADLDRFAQLPPGSAVRFALVDGAEARRAAAGFAAAVAAIPDALVDAAGDLSSERLLGLNLVGGWIDGQA